MSRTKTKRILWTIAGLVALSLVAAMVLHKHEEPKVIGNLSKEDVSEISKLVLDSERHTIKAGMRWNLRKGLINRLPQEIKYYFLMRVLSLEALPDGHVSIKRGAGTNELYRQPIVLKNLGRWMFMVEADPVMRSASDQTTNTAPENRK